MRCEQSQRVRASPFVANRRGGGERLAATVMDRLMPIFIVTLTTIRCHPSLAQNDLTKPSK
jgi:hypothetical protein